MTTEALRSAGIKEDKHILQIPAFHIPGIDLIIGSTVQFRRTEGLTGSAQPQKFKPLGIPVSVDLIDIDFQRQ